MLAKHIRSQLLPTQDEDSQPDPLTDPSRLLPPFVVETAIKSVMDRNNYGIDPPASTTKMPSGLYVWRWEVKPEHRDWLPKASRQKAETRLAERIQVRRVSPI